MKNPVTRSRRLSNPSNRRTDSRVAFGWRLSALAATALLLLPVTGCGGSDKRPAATIPSVGSSADRSAATDGTPATVDTAEGGSEGDQAIGDTESAQSLTFFQGTRAACAQHAEQTGNPVVPDEWFDDAAVVERLDGDAWSLLDGGGNRLIVDPVEGVVYSEDGRDAVLPMEYSFGCPESLYLGSMDH